MCVYAIFIYSSVSGHLNFFHTLAIVNDASVNMGVQLPLQDTNSFPLDICLEIGLLDPMVGLFFFLLGPHLWHMEIPRLGVELELQLPAYTTATATPDPSCNCDLHYGSWQCW